MSRICGYIVLWKSGHCFSRWELTIFDGNCFAMSCFATLFKTRRAANRAIKTDGRESKAKGLLLGVFKIVPVKEQE